MTLRLERFYCKECDNFVPSCLCHTYASPHSWLDDESRAIVVESLCSSGYLLFSAESYALHFTQELHRCSSVFFSSPLEIKTAACSKDKARRGYSPLDTENFAALIGTKDKPNDSVEKYRYGPIVDTYRHQQLEVEQESYFLSKAAKIHFFPNAIENLDQDYQQALERYYKLMEKLSLCILYILEAAFYLEGGSLAGPSKSPYHTSILSINHYPLDPSIPSEAERVAEHTDVSLFTIVTEVGHLNDICPHVDTPVVPPKLNTQLQIVNRHTNEWIDIELGPEQFLVNIGDYLQYVSEGRLHSARHRVINLEDGNVPRESFAYFCTPRYDAIIDWRPTTWEHMDTEEDRGDNSKKFKSTDNILVEDIPEDKGYARELSYHEFRKAKIAKVVKSLRSK